MVDAHELNLMLRTLQDISREEIEVMHGREIGARAWEAFAADPVRGFLRTPVDVQRSITMVLNSKIETKETLALPRLHLPRREHDIYEALKGFNLKKSTDFIPPERLFSAVYESDAETEVDTLYSHISKLRKKLERHGWTIASARFRGYRLEPING